MQDGEAKDLAQMEENASDEALAVRLLETGVAYAKSVLREYVEKAEKVEAYTDELTSVDHWQFVMQSQVDADGQTVADLLHWLVVKVALMEWAKMFAPSEAVQVGADVMDAVASLTATLKTTPMPMKTRRDIVCGDDNEIEITYTC